MVNFLHTLKGTLRSYIKKINYTQQFVKQTTRKKNSIPITNWGTIKIH